MLGVSGYRLEAANPIKQSRICQGRETATRRRPGLALLLLGLFGLWASLQPGASRAESPGPQKRVAVLPIEFLKADYFPDHDVISAAEQTRLDMVARIIRERLGSEGYDVVSGADTAAAVAAADPGSRLHECNGCELDIGRSLHAQWVLVNWIQMVSNLIVNLNVVAYQVDSGAPIAQTFVDLRGNNDRSWRRATEYLLDRILVRRLNTARQRDASSGSHCPSDRGTGTQDSRGCPAASQASDPPGYQ